ncbi:MAG: bifunctional enoyl-CoA hydratase/phosphate acetyltransferase [bacterium]|nr:bifunctional enoyl-CoA hydratase/phosphate acetyltransferase [bacterium]
MLTSFDQVLEKVKTHPIKQVAVVCAQDNTVLEAVVEAKKLKIADYLLIGDKTKILDIAKKYNILIEEDRILDETNDLMAIRRGTDLIHKNKADILMKGFIHTDDFLRGIVDRETGLRTGNFLSHVFVLELVNLKKLVFVTDGSMNIAPTLEEKSQIILNAIYMADIFEILDPKVGVLAAVELVNPKMPATLDAAALAQMSKRGQFSRKVTIDGPLAFDNIISMWAAEHKGITGPVAGNADIILVPNIETGNSLVKSHVWLCKGNVAGVIVGAQAPVVLTSRVDSAKSKLYSIATAVLMSSVERQLRVKIGKVHC